MFEPINKIIKKHKKTTPGVFQAAKICHQAGEVIEELIPGAKGKIKIVSFSLGKLKIASSDPILLHQIKMSQSQLAKNIKEKAAISDFKIIYSPRD